MHTRLERWKETVIPSTRGHMKKSHCWSSESDSVSGKLNLVQMACAVALEQAEQETSTRCTMTSSHTTLQMVSELCDWLAGSAVPLCVSGYEKFHLGLQSIDVICTLFIS